MARPTSRVSKMAQRSHGFLLTLILLMILSLAVWAYFLYCTPLGELELEDSFHPTRHSSQQANVAGSIEADLNSVGSVDNSSDLNDIDQAFR